MERRKFEDSFKQAFDEAEVNTSDNVWTGIELELEKAEGEKTKAQTFVLQIAGRGVGHFCAVRGWDRILYHRQ